MLAYIISVTDSRGVDFAAPGLSSRMRVISIIYLPDDTYKNFVYDDIYQAACRSSRSIDVPINSTIISPVSKTL